MKYSSNKAKVNAFVKEWEDKWKKNNDTGNDEAGHCWIDCEPKLIVNEIDVEE